MKKYIFTESQIKKVIDSLVTEQSMGSQTMTGTLANMEYTNVNPQLVDTIKKSGKFKVTRVDNSGNGVMVNGKPAAVGQIITPMTQIMVPMSGYLYISGMGLPNASISFGTNNLTFSGIVA